MDAKESWFALVHVTRTYSREGGGGGGGGDRGDRGDIQRYGRQSENERERERGRSIERRMEGLRETKEERRGRTGNATESHGGRRGNYGSFLTCQRCA